MQFPSEWSDKHPQPPALAGGKRRKITSKSTANQDSTHAVDPPQPPQSHDRRDEELKTLLLQCDAEHRTLCEQNANADYDDSIVGMIKRQVNNSRFAPAMPEELQLDHVLSSVPYRDMLESLFGSISGPPPNLPIVTKAYEESYMREAAAGEKQCAMGSRCECMFIDHNAPFVCVQFDLPGDMTEPNNPQDTPKLCVLCSRKTTQKLFYDACYSGKRVQGLIQRYGNLCNQPGEYARDCMLICPPGAPWHCLPLPIMSHQRNRYKVHIVAGVKHLQQLRVSYEDFFVSPSGRA
jgi:hypothetical protein